MKNNFCKNKSGKLLIRFTFSFALAVTAFAYSFAQPVLIEEVKQTSPDTLVIPYQKWKLPNGLTVILHEDHSDPLVYVNVTYHVGSARESIRRSGFAHFFEHMMFQGSEHVKDEEHFKIISEAGGDLNGQTQRDFTQYFETIPGNQLETALWLESDRMGFLLDSVTSQKFEVQRDAVKNEKFQGVESQPYGLALYEMMDQTLYPYGHPYSWPTIGYVDDLNAATLADVKNFFLRWYGPNNALLTIAGDINSKEALALVEKYFGGIPAGPEVKKMRTSQVTLASDRYTNTTDKIYLPLIYMNYPTVPSYHRDEPALDILADILGGGNNSILYKNFVKSEKAIQAVASHPTYELGGEFQIQVFSYPEDILDMEKHFNEAEKKIRESLDELEKTGITDEAIQRAKASREAELINSITSVQGKASMLSTWFIFAGRPINMQDELKRYNAVTKEDILRVYNKYIKGKGAAIVNVYPRSPGSKDTVKSVNPYAGATVTVDPEYANLRYVKAQDNLNRFQQPAAGASRAPKVPDYYTSQMSNGLKIIGAQSDEAPLVVIQMEINGGTLVVTDPKKYDVASLTATLMNEGTKNRTSEQLSSELEKLGSSIAFRAGKQSTMVSIQSLTRNLDATLKLFEEMLFSPRFDETDFKRVKRETIGVIENQKNQPQSQAGNLFANLIYGNTPLGYYPVRKNVAGLSLDDVKNYYNNFYSPSVASVVVVGNISEKDALAKLKFLEKWQSKEVKIPDITGFPVVEQTQIYLVNKEFIPHAYITMGHLGIPYDATGDYYRSTLLNYPLGGAFNSRITQNLREKKGFTYGIYSAFSGTKYPGTFSISSSVKRTAADSAITEVMKELKGFRTGGMTIDELSFTRQSFLNSDALEYETPAQKAGFLSRIIRYNLPKDFISQQNEILKKITKEELNTLANKYINPDKMVIVVVGDKFFLKEKLEKLGYGKVKEMNP